MDSKKSFLPKYQLNQKNNEKKNKKQNKTKTKNKDIAFTKKV